MSTKLAPTAPAVSAPALAGRPGAVPPRDLSLRCAQVACCSPLDTAAPAPVVVGSAGGELSFELSRGPGSVLVARTHRRGDGTRLHCAALFEGPEALLEWLDADDMRFTHPLVFQQLKRSFAELHTPREAQHAARG